MQLDPQPSPQSIDKRNTIHLLIDTTQYPNHNTQSNPHFKMSALLLSLSTPADHSDSKIIWPWCPYSQRPQVDQGDSLDMYMEKTALVRKIARFYEQPSEIYPFTRNFTGWQHALFYSLTPATLRRLAPFPSRIKTLGDNAKPFAHLCKSYGPPPDCTSFFRRPH